MGIARGQGPPGARPPWPRRLALPLVWLLAGAFLAMNAVSAACVAVLDWYVAITDRLGQLITAAIKACRRGLVRFVRLVLQLLGPIGSLLRRGWSRLAKLLRPAVTAFLRLLRRGWEWLNLWVLLRMFRPVGRFFRWAYRRFPHLYAALRRAYVRAVARLEPVVRRLDAMTAAVERAAARLRLRLRKAWAPVAVVAARWRSRGAVDGDLGRVGPPT